MATDVQIFGNAGYMAAGRVKNPWHQGDSDLWVGHIHQYFPVGSSLISLFDPEIRVPLLGISCGRSAPRVRSVPRAWQHHVDTLRFFSFFLSTRREQGIGFVEQFPLSDAWVHVRNRVCGMLSASLE
jgi:hypothetical protein